MDNKLPNLVNLNEDPQLSEMLLYMLKEGTMVWLKKTSLYYFLLSYCDRMAKCPLIFSGETTVGRRQTDVCTDHDIQLNGVLVAENHW